MLHGQWRRTGDLIVDFKVLLSIMLYINIMTSALFAVASPISNMFINPFDSYN